MSDLRSRVRDSRKAALCREYADDAIREVIQASGWPHTISWTDLDGMPGRYVYEHNDHFLFFEFKTGADAAPPHGQMEMFAKLVRRLGSLQSLLCLVSHTEVGLVDIATHMTSYRICMCDNLGLADAPSDVFVSKQLVKHADKDAQQRLTDAIANFALRASGKLNHFVTHSRQLLKDEKTTVWRGRNSFPYSKWFKEVKAKWQRRN